MTATTPSSTAVRLDTGVVALEVSNSAPSSGLLPGQLRRSMYSVLSVFSIERSPNIGCGINLLANHNKRK